MGVRTVSVELSVGTVELPEIGSLKMPEYKALQEALAGIRAGEFEKGFDWACEILSRRCGIDPDELTPNDCGMAIGAVLKGDRGK